MRDDERTNEQLKIELLSQWKLEAEFRNSGREASLILEIERQKLVQYSRLVKIMHKEKK